MTKNILLVGVGGQGTILAGKILSQGLMEAGYDVKMSEIHGMSQRGGSVSTQVRYGERVHSPVIEKGGADIIVAFEKMEALRWLSYAKPGALVAVNDYEIMPMPVIMGKAEYSGEILNEIAAAARMTAVKAYDEAAALGNAKALNMILLGVTVRLMELSDIGWNKIITDNVKPAFAELNLRAFARGAELAGC